MNQSKLKTYAPKARRDFIRAMTDRAAIYGLSENKIEPVTEKGDVAIIAGKAYPASVAAKRRALEDRIKRQGFRQVMEACAYTWFNRFAAIRFLEIHGYLDHGYRVLSHPEGKTTPEIVEHAEHVDLPGLDKNKVIELKLDGTKENELYRMLLIAQCNALHSAMPFLFERIDDETELLLPDNLLHSDSLIRQLVNEIDETDWQEVEIIGWLYQFYISEKYDEVIGKVVKSEDIPAATQRFTPNWIVKYLVQNTLGRQWLATYPHSPLRQQMEYYIEPAEQAPEVQRQLKAITPTELSPEELTLMDPACGSGHILVEGYDIFKAIYQERGYRAKDIPVLILQKNLFGLEIDDRAAQLAAFALMMKARADDRRIFDTDANPNILAIQESTGLDAKEITEALNHPLLRESVPSSGELFEEIADEKSPLFSRKHLSVKGGMSLGQVTCLIDLFEHGKTFGSLIQVPATVADKLPAIAQRTEEVIAHGGMFEKAMGQAFMPLVRQAHLLSRKYRCVVMNPPYMGSRYFNPTVKRFVKAEYETGMGDLCTAFLLRSRRYAISGGHLGMITFPNWMFLPTFERLRVEMCENLVIESLSHNGRGVFGADFGSCAFVIRNHSAVEYRGSYRRLFDVASLVIDNDELSRRFLTRPFFWASMSQLKCIPGTPIAYWIDERFRRVFEEGTPFEQLAAPRQGLATGDNDRFLRLWSEIDKSRIAWNCKCRKDAVASGKRWFPYSKGGPFRRWSGNNYLVVDWANDGEAIRGFYGDDGKLRSRPQNMDCFFRPALTWSLTSVSQLGFAARYRPAGCIFDINGMSAFPETRELVLLGLLNSVVAFEALKIINPTFSFQAGDIAKIPVVLPESELEVAEMVRECVEISQHDWDSYETSWGFREYPLLHRGPCRESVRNSYDMWVRRCQAYRDRMLELERHVNRLFVERYGFTFDVDQMVFAQQITSHVTSSEEDTGRLISYILGCMMGRYSLDTPGLIYAHGGNRDFDFTQYRMFPADQDGIIPLTDTAWFDDDATNRVVEFIGVAWPKEHLEENVGFVAESLGLNKGEQPRDTIRRYLAQDFFKDHLKTYKKRPIYWLFASGKQRAFQCLVYLHRYNEGTLSRMRTEYVIPLQGKISARIEQLAGDIAAATSTAFRSKLTKERDKLIKQQAELQAFDEKLRHYADLRISLDLDDGVKVNYGKFGDLLAEVRAVTGGKDEE